MAEVGPFEKISLNDTANISVQADGSVLIKTGADGFAGSQFALTSEGQIMVDGVEYQGAAPDPVEPATPVVPGYTSMSLLNGWQNNGDTAQWKQSTAGYRKHDDGTVELTGLIKGTTVGTNICNLPAGFRPANQKAAVVVCAANGDTLGTLKIQPNGNVLFSSGAPGLVFLTGVRFSLA